jgi:hypothetical protein
MTMMFWYGWHMPVWQASLMWVGSIVFWGLLIWGAYVLITSLRRRAGTGDRHADQSRYSTSG